MTPQFNGPVTDFCRQAQYLLTGTTVPATNVVHADYDALYCQRPRSIP